MRTQLFLSGVLFFALCALPASHLWGERAKQAPHSEGGHWQENIDWQQLKTLPVQQGGRVMPLDSFARVLLRQLSGRDTLSVGEERWSAVQWLLEVLFNEPAAISREVILVENPAVLEDLGLDYKKPRDRYPYTKFASKMQLLHQKASQLQQIESENRTLEQTQLLHLHTKLHQFKALINTFAFWKPRNDLDFPNQSIAQYLSGIAQRRYQIHQASHHGEQTPELQAEMKQLENKLRILHERKVPPLYNGLFAVFPPRESDPEQTWKYPWYVFYDLFYSEDPRHQQLKLFGDLFAAYHQQDAQKFNTALEEIHNGIVSDAKEQNQYKAIELEVKYNDYQLFEIALAFYIMAALFCCFSWGGRAGGKPQKIFYWLAVSVAALAFVSHTTGIIFRMIIRERPPVSTLYESILFVGWVSVLISFLLEYFSRKSKSLPLFTAAMAGNILLFVAGRYANEGDNMGVLVAVLDSNFWLATHVTSITIGYSACLVAGIIGHFYIALHFFPSAIVERHRKEMTRMTYGTVCFATIVAFLGTVLGGIWADQSWGRFWGWDPKENGALLIVLWNVVILHGRMEGMIRDWGLALTAIFGNIIVAAAWWGVNLLNVGLHSYGFTSGLANNLAAFTLFEIGVIFLGVVMSYRYKKMYTKANIALAMTSCYAAASIYITYLLFSGQVTL